MADKFALLIGCNYKGSDYPLDGCWNDVNGMKAYLLTRGYVLENMEVMTDEAANQNTDKLPTKVNILKAFERLVAKSHLPTTKTIFLHFSGHGGFLPDRNGDEADRRDECIFSSDLEMIIDDDIRKLIVARIPEGVKLRAVFDSCNSGSAIDLNYRYVPFKGLYRENSTALNRDAVFISGSRDDQFSADAFIDQKPQGALTANLLKLLNKPQPGWRWHDFTKILQYVMRSEGFDQVPQVSVCLKETITGLVDI